MKMARCAQCKEVFTAYRNDTVCRECASSASMLKLMLAQSIPCDDHDACERGPCKIRASKEEN